MIYQRPMTSTHYLFFLIIYISEESFRAAAEMSQSGDKGKVSLEARRINVTVTLSRREGFLIKYW